MLKQRIKSGVVCPNCIVDIEVVNRDKWRCPKCGTTWETPLKGKK